ncbi:MAG: tetratricopeptide repeat protein [Thermoplasmata archaeon]|nr:tetratricopeptide repeat protein [Thermoplasmata archaeon]
MLNLRFLKTFIQISIILVIWSILLIPSSSNCNAEPDPELIIESELRYLFGTGGGDVTITVKGDLALAIRRDILNETKFNHDGTISEEIQKEYTEAIEDLLEKNINDARKFIDDKPENAGIEYGGTYKLIDLGGTGRADIQSTEGLSGTTNKSKSKITIKMDIKGELLSDSVVTLSDGYIMLYALLGENIDESDSVELQEITNSIEVQETTKVSIIGMNSYSNYEFDSGGELSRYRLVLGEYIVYKHEYELSGYEMSDDKKDTVSFDGFNIVENALILAIVTIILTIIPSRMAKYYIKRDNLNKVKILGILGLIFFIILAILYFGGFASIIIWLMNIVFCVINIVLVMGIYQKGWGNLAMVTIRREDFIKEPPKIDDGPWHERGISNAKVGNFREAINCFENALESEPENPIIWNDLGFVLRKLGKNRQAIECFNKALEFRSDYPTARENLEKAKAEMPNQRKRKVRS